MPHSRSCRRVRTCLLAGNSLAGSNRTGADGALLRQFKTCSTHHCTSNMPPTHCLRRRMNPSPTRGIATPSIAACAQTHTFAYRLLAADSIRAKDDALAAAGFAVLQVRPPD